MHDIAVLGITPAGLAAAYYLASHKADVVVVGAPGEPAECPLADWVPRESLAEAGLPKSLDKLSGAKAFTDVMYHNAKMDGESLFHSRSRAGYFVQPARLAEALKKAAVAAGARVCASTTFPAIRLDEDGVRLIGTTQVAARVLIVAANHPQEIISELSLPMRTVPQSTITASALDVPLTGKSGIAPGMHVVEMRERSELGMFFEHDGVVHVRFISNSMAGGPHAAELSRLFGGLQKAGLLPADLSLGKARGAVWRPPAGVALELETHVAKRCLLSGTAGGFADSITGQTLTPTIKSALLAAQVAQAALEATDVQDALMHYKTSWRKSLADHLRPPNTSLQMLLPLLFVNKRIVAKFTHALLYGANI